jgi:hypothetical protein
MLRPQKANSPTHKPVLMKKKPCCRLQNHCAAGSQQNWRQWTCPERLGERWEVSTVAGGLSLMCLFQYLHMSDLWFACYKVDSVVHNYIVVSDRDLTGYLLIILTVFHFYSHNLEYVACYCWLRRKARGRECRWVWSMPIAIIPPASVHRDWGTRYKYEPVKEGYT